MDARDIFVSAPAGTKNPAVLPVSFLLIVLSLFSSCGRNDSYASGSSPIPQSRVTRIVSFAPSVTEILYELGLGDRVCGVTRFCNYPPEAAQKKKIGGPADRNYEAVVRLKPDLAVILKEQRDMAAFFDKYSIRYVVVGSDSVGEILESIISVAKACSVEDRGRAVVEDLRKRMESASGDVNADKVKVLLCVSRDGIGTGAIGKCFVAGAASFYDRLIDAAGGVNVMNGVRQAYPAISAEAVIGLAPDVIIDISESHINDRSKRQKSCDDWKPLKSVPAVKTGRIYCLYGDYLTIPGPRVGLILEDFGNALHQR